MFYKQLRIFFTGIQNHTQIKHCGRYLKERHASVSSFRRKNLCHLKPENDNSWLWEDDSGRKTTSQEEGIFEMGSINNGEFGYIFIFCFTRFGCGKHHFKREKRDYFFV